MNDNDYIRFLRNLSELNNNLNADQRDYIRRKNNKHIERQRKFPTSDTGYPVSDVGNFPAPGVDLDIKELLPDIEIIKYVEIISYCMIPNHFHLILKQLEDDGISLFMKKLSDSYTLYFNKKYQRSGYLFQGKFRSAHLKSEPKLWWMSAYVNCNIEIHGIDRAENWIRSSYLDYIGKRNGKLCNKEMVMKEFISVEEYKNFCKEVVREIKEKRKEIKELLE